ncbi:unnamed protein product [Pleuronectes platessa]|uniref:Uncharacterized protein n=1 Tax=Pleuronectes platessa TaxID=8262 RepID=A0A9N7UJQ5_PLEPL|nr:unnamed protein product [Pleuronectes platessa]
MNPSDDLPLFTSAIFTCESGLRVLTQTRERETLALDQQSAGSAVDTVVGLVLRLQVVNRRQLPPRLVPEVLFLIPHADSHTLVIPAACWPRPPRSTRDCSFFFLALRPFSSNALIGASANIAIARLMMMIMRVMVRMRRMLVPTISADCATRGPKQSAVYPLS